MGYLRKVTEHILKRSVQTKPNYPGIWSRPFFVALLPAAWWRRNECCWARVPHLDRCASRPSFSVDTVQHRPDRNRRTGVVSYRPTETNCLRERRVKIKKSHAPAVRPSRTRYLFTRRREQIFITTGHCESPDRHKTVLRRRRRALDYYCSSVRDLRYTLRSLQIAR